LVQNTVTYFMDGPFVDTYYLSVITINIVSSILFYYQFLLVPLRVWKE